MSSEKRKVDDVVDNEESETKKAKTGESNGAEENGSKTDGDGSKKPSKEPSGTLLICGQMNWELTGRPAKKGSSEQNECLWSPHVLTPLSGTKIHKVVSGCASAHSIAIDEQGQVWSWGRNEFGQLGHGDLERRDVPTVIDALKGISFKDAACGRNHTLLVADDGAVYSFGSNSMGQCGVGSKSANVKTPQQVMLDGRKGMKVAAGSDFSLIIDDRNCMYSCGSHENGQLGHNTDGKFLDGRRWAFHTELSPKKIALYIEKERDGTINPVHDVEIVDVTCGVTHSVARDKRGRVFTWGFGGYGRLGHDSTKDEYVPRLLKPFDNPNLAAGQIYCGSSYSIATVHGAMYLWGQRNMSSEANMYPKPVVDLHGWTIHSVGTGFSSMVIFADDSFISTGTGTCFGELGHGEGRKSCARPTEIKLLDGIHGYQVACGRTHTMIIARDSSPEDRKLLDKLPEYDPED